MSTALKVNEDSVAAGLMTGLATYLGFNYTPGQAVVAGSFQALSAEIGERLTYALKSSHNSNVINLEKAASSGLVAVLINNFYVYLPGGDSWGFNFLFSSGMNAIGQLVAETMRAGGHSISNVVESTSTITN